MSSDPSVDTAAQSGSEPGGRRASVDGAQDAWSLSWSRLLISLVVGTVVFLFVYQGPPVDQVFGFDLRFGLSGPNAGDPWKWLGAALLLVAVFAIEGLGLSALLIRKPTAADLHWVLYAFGGFMVWSWILSFVAPQDDNQGIQTIAGIGVVGVLLLIITAAVTEEIVYRGFLAERLGALFGRRPWARWAGAGLSFAVFVAPHIAFFDTSWLLHQMPGAIMIALIALLRRNLVAAMLLHLLMNLPILIPTIASSM